jgi:hypothetical protein
MRNTLFAMRNTLFAAAFSIRSPSRNASARKTAVRRRLSTVRLSAVQSYRSGRTRCVGVASKGFSGQ